MSITWVAIEVIPYTLIFGYYVQKLRSFCVLNNFKNKQFKHKVKQFDMFLTSALL